MHDSRFRTWPTGDTHVVYPHGCSAIRVKRMLEGIQDYEKVQVILKKLQEKGDKKNLAKLDKAITRLDFPNRRRTWNDDLNAAKELLNSL